MQKLTLDVDALTVETFAAAIPQEDAGTVLGAEASGQRCSAVDACPSARGCTTISPCSARGRGGDEAEPGFGRRLRNASFPAVMPPARRGGRSMR